MRFGSQLLLFRRVKQDSTVHCRKNALAIGRVATGVVTDTILIFAHLRLSTVLVFFQHSVVIRDRATTRKRGDTKCERGSVAKIHAGELANSRATDKWRTREIARRRSVVQDTKNHWVQGSPLLTTVVILLCHNIQHDRLTHSHQHTHFTTPDSLQHALTIRSHLHSRRSPDHLRGLPNAFLHSTPIERKKWKNWKMSTKFPRSSNFHIRTSFVFSF
jgi:hypothetical protein